MTIDNEKEGIAKKSHVSQKRYMRNIDFLPEHCLETKERTKRTQKTPINYKLEDNNELGEKENQDDDDQTSDFVQNQSRYKKKKKPKRKQNSNKTYVQLKEKERKKDLKKEAKKEMKKALKRRLSKRKPINSLEEQIEYFLQWKTLSLVTQSNELLEIDREYFYAEVNSFDDIDWNHKFIMQNAQAVLVSPPWNYCRSTDPYLSPNKTKVFDFNMFQEMKIPFDKIDNGMIFIWTKKEVLDQMISYITSFQGIHYVENLVWVQLQRPKEDKLVHSNIINIPLSHTNTNTTPSNLLNDYNKHNDSFDNSPTKKMLYSQTSSKEMVIDNDLYNHEDEVKDNAEAKDKHINYFCNTDILNKRTSNNSVFSNSFLSLLLFKKKNKTEHLEFRHQRTIDTVLDYYGKNLFIINPLCSLDEDDPNYTPRDFIYSMIETMLPESKSLIDKQLKRIEIFSPKNAKREGWVHINYLPSNYK